MTETIFPLWTILTLGWAGSFFFPLCFPFPFPYSLISFCIYLFVGPVRVVSASICRLSTGAKGFGGSWPPTCFLGLSFSFLWFIYFSLFPSRCPRQGGPNRAVFPHSYPVQFRFGGRRHVLCRALSACTWFQGYRHSSGEQILGYGGHPRIVDLRPRQGTEGTLDLFCEVITQADGYDGRLAGPSWLVLPSTSSVPYAKAPIVFYINTGSSSVCARFQFFLLSLSLLLLLVLLSYCMWTSSSNSFVLSFFLI